MHPSDILTELDRRNACVEIRRNNNAWTSDAQRWFVSLSFKGGDNTELIFNFAGPSFESALTGAWAKADPWLATVPGRTQFQPVLTHAPINDEIPF